VPKKRESSLSLHYKLFGKHHVPDIVGTFGGAATAGYMTRKEIMVALRDTCTYLDERKYLFERMILALENEEADGEGSVKRNLSKTSNSASRRQGNKRLKPMKIEKD
jgi:hypothetical protein